MGDMTPNFSKSEFACRCGCGEDRISPDLVERLQLTRDAFGRGIKINSGCRCVEHNKKEGGSPTSSHLVKDREVDGNGWTGGRQETSVAVDLQCATSRDRYRLLSCLMKSGIRRIGIHEKFLHVDIDPDKDDEVAFLY
mgnify:CR=1 FL=1